MAVAKRETLSVVVNPFTSPASWETKRTRALLSAKGSLYCYVLDAVGKVRQTLNVP